MKGALLNQNNFIAVNAVQFHVTIFHPSLARFGLLIKSMVLKQTVTTG